MTGAKNADMYDATDEDPADIVRQFHDGLPVEQLAGPRAIIVGTSVLTIKDPNRIRDILNGLQNPGLTLQDSRLTIA